MTHPDTLQRAAFEAWYDSGAENRDEFMALVDAALQPQATAEPVCWCTTCRPITMEDMRFVVCPDCGNKRCPKAHNHSLQCTDSNDVGQAGSNWEHIKKDAAEPVAIAHVGNMDHGPFDITPTAYGCDHLKNGDKLYTSPPDPGGLLRDALAQSIIAENARGLRESNEGIYAHPDTLQRAAFEDWYDSGAENRDEFMALVDAALQPQAAFTNYPVSPDARTAFKKAAAEPVEMNFELLRCAVRELRYVKFGFTQEDYKKAMLDIAELEFCTPPATQAAIAQIGALGVKHGGI